MTASPRRSHLVLVPAARATETGAATKPDARRYRLARLTIFEGRDQRVAQGAAPAADGGT